MPCKRCDAKVGHYQPCIEYHPGGGCPGGYVKMCEGCNELYYSCPCGCSSWDSCICSLEDNAIGEEICTS